jgi:hypothetical protein
VPGEKIDSLTLDIGLTSEEFQAGVNKILGSMERMESQAAETGESMSASFASLGSSVLGLAWRFAGLFLAVKSIEGVVDYFKDLSKELADVGMAAEYLGVSSIELRRFGEVAKLAGGQAQDAAAGVKGLEASIFGLEFQGQVSQQLIMLQRLGVAYLTAGGQMRDFKEIVFAVADALQRQLPGEGNRAMRVQYAAQIFGAGGLANAIGGPINELRTFYAKSVEDNKKITDKTIERQVQLQRDLTDLSYQVKGEAAAILDHLTPTIEKLIKTIETELIPTIDELIGDLMDWMHPGKMLEEAASGPLGWKHPINDLAHFGAMLGADFADAMQNYRAGTLAAITVPPQVTSRIASDTNLDALKLLHIQQGGDSGDPTWSRAITAYASLGGAREAARYVALAQSRGDVSPEAGTGEMLYRRGKGGPPAIPQWFSPGALSTPSAARPASAAPGAPGTPPTGSTSGPRVQIGSMTINTQATDAAGLVADLNRQMQRKFLVSQSDPGLA